MSGGKSTACDVWSLGCTVVELITGQPPYFDLEPMPALFRIVQDPHPPLPAGISPAMEDFLLLCFQKDPNLRSSAFDLMKHPLIRSSENHDFLSIEKDICVEATDGMAEFLTQTMKFQLGKYPQELSTNSKATRQDFTEGKDNTISIQSGKSKHILDLVNQEANQNTVRMNVMQATPLQVNRINLAQFEEKESKVGMVQMQNIDISKLNNRNISETLDLRNVSEDELEDPFADFIDDSDMKIDHDQKILDEITKQISHLQPVSTEFSKILKSIELLQDLLKRNPGHIDRVIAKHGVVLFMEMLGVPNEDVLLALLKLLFNIGQMSFSFLQSLCLVGLIPVITKFIRERYSYHIRMEASKFIREFCTNRSFDDKTGVLMENQNNIKRIFIASGGLQSIVALIDQSNYETYKNLVRTGIDCIELILETSTSLKSDFCRLFCKAGIVRPLMNVLVESDADMSSARSKEYVKRICDILLTFVNYGKNLVKSYLSRKSVVAAMLKILKSKDIVVKAKMLRVIQIMSSDDNFNQNVEKVGMMPVLVRLLESGVPDIEATTLTTLLNLFRVVKSRQEQMALCGIIPVAQRYVLNNHVARAIPLQILCDLAFTSAVSRTELRKHGAIEFYLELLNLPYWRARALDSIAAWLSADAFRVETILIQNQNLHRVIKAFEAADSNDLDNIVKALSKIISGSKKINRALGKSSQFVDAFVSRLRKGKAVIQKPLLEMIRGLMEQSFNPKTFGGKQGLDAVLMELENENKSVIVQRLAEKILKDFVKSSK